MALTVADIINIAKISQYLAAQDTSRGQLFGQRVAPMTPIILYVERMSVEYIYDNDPSNTALYETANYLYSLCRGYNLKAQSITGGGGGSVVPVTPISAPNPLNFIVDGSTPVSTGETSVLLTSFIGYNILFARGGVPQSTLSSESSYYSWNKTTGQFTITPAAGAGELFQIYPI